MGGVSAVAVATGVSRTTLMAGISEIEAMKSTDHATALTSPQPMRTRQAGAGRKKIERKDETLKLGLPPDLLALVD